MTKSLLVILSLLGMSVLAQAQTNPQPGFIITNENDTIWGTIDYLSDLRNMNACLFKAGNEQTYHEYKPEEISGYRLSNNGIFYVTRTLMIGNTEKTVFAEYLPDPILLLGG